MKKIIKIEFPQMNLFETEQYFKDNFIIDQISGRMVRKSQFNDNINIIIFDHMDKIK